MQRIFALFFFVLLVFEGMAEIKLPAIFTHGMVLQQDIHAPIWGWGDAGAKVKVSFAGQVQRGTVAEDGSWKIKLKPLKANDQAQKMTIEVGKDKTKIIDILVGEVWVLSGQSNMDWDLGKLSNKAKDPQYQPIVDLIQKEVAEANDPLLRQIAVPKVTSYDKPLQQFEGEWLSSKPDNNSLFSGTGYFFAKELRKELNVPVGLIKVPYGGKPVESFIPIEAYQADPQLKAYYDTYLKATQEKIDTYDPEKTKKVYEARVAKWKEAYKKAKQEKKPLPRKPRTPVHPKLDTGIPATLYNGMVNPVVSYGIKGALWYQGESNRSRDPQEYRKRLQALIQGWRKAWGQDDFPFYYCQLAGYLAPPSEPVAEDGWVTVCDQMRLALSLKNTGMAVLNDIGEEKDIHPRNKIDAGKRLALWALAKDYGRTDLSYSGPLYDSHRIEGSKVMITFKEVAEGLTVARKHLLEPAKETGEALSGFQILGKDGQWKWAQAKIVSKDQIEVFHPQVTEPVEVRYAWASNPTRANLYNKAGLPTSVFSTATK